MVHGYAPMGFEDWPVVAVAILLGIAIWTRLLASGVATWTTHRVELYLQDR
jgi:hypothetical protein